ncbi:basic helix-loop-helix ARNT-like protein 2 isoform 1-T2 [Acanthopagrus schlegelii]
MPLLQTREKINTNCYKFKIKDGSFITVRSRWFGFMNPWTKEVEHIVSTSTVVTSREDGCPNRDWNEDRRWEDWADDCRGTVGNPEDGHVHCDLRGPAGVGGDGLI